MPVLADDTPRRVRVRDVDGVWHDATALGPSHNKGRCDLCNPGKQPPMRHDFCVQWVSIDGASDNFNPIPWPITDVEEIDP